MGLVENHVAVGREVDRIGDLDVITLDVHVVGLGIRCGVRTCGRGGAATAAETTIIEIASIVTSVFSLDHTELRELASRR